MNHHHALNHDVQEGYSTSDRVRTFNNHFFLSPSQHNRVVKELSEWNKKLAAKGGMKNTSGTSNEENLRQRQSSRNVACLRDLLGFGRERGSAS